MYQVGILNSMREFYPAVTGAWSGSSQSQKARHSERQLPTWLGRLGNPLEEVAFAPVVAAAVEDPAVVGSNFQNTPHRAAHAVLAAWAVIIGPSEECAPCIGTPGTRPKEPIFVRARLPHPP